MSTSHRSTHVSHAAHALCTYSFPPPIFAHSIFLLLLLRFLSYSSPCVCWWHHSSCVHSSPPVRARPRLHRSASVRRAPRARHPPMSRRSRIRVEGRRGWTGRCPSCRGTWGGACARRTAATTRERGARISERTGGRAVVATMRRVTLVRPSSYTACLPGCPVTR
jgi:hypothetical protein